MTDPMGDLGEHLDGWHELLLGDDDLDEALDVAIRLTRQSLGEPPDGGLEVSVTVRPRNDGPHTRAASDDVARELDEWQYRHGRGPCVTSDEQGAVCAIADVQHDDTFPEFAGVAADEGIRGVATFPLCVRETSIGSLNLFHRQPGRIDDAFVETGRQLAATFAPMLANFLAHERSVELTDQLHEALESRSVIERAKGLLMGRLAITAEEAFALLSSQSQHENRKVRDVAATMVEHHERALELERA